MPPDMAVHAEGQIEERLPPRYAGAQTGQRLTEPGGVHCEALRAFTGDLNGPRDDGIW